MSSSRSNVILEVKYHQQSSTVILEVRCQLQKQTRQKTEVFVKNQSQGVGLWTKARWQHWVGVSLVLP